VVSVLLAGQRKALSDVVAGAREVVESACAQRITALGVASDRVPDVLDEGERVLRRGLRARARQLGSVEALAAEAGFEQWHRMLFARYLADNGMLVDDQTGQSVTIDEIAEYAAELGEADMWELAARFAAAMLPGLFRQDDPVLQLRLPIETRQKLEDLLSSLPPEIITAEDSLGWVYQYWQSRRKDDVNRTGNKIGGADLPPVTQLFTENYMVRFLLENSLGAWWATNHPDSPLLAEWKYLRFADDGTPAAGTFDEWPKTTAEVTIIDPCCGSGHFLTAAFEMLWRMRAEEEGMSTTAAQDAVLSDNLFGLELDPRCTQIAAFALALEAWKSGGGYRPLPIPNIACSGIPAKAPLSDWTDHAGTDEVLKAALARLHALFTNADTLGSLIDPVRATEQAGLESVDWHTIAPLVTEALSQDTSGGDPAAAVFGEAATSIARAADYLTRTYTLVVTNPPYLGRNKQGTVLRNYSVEVYPNAEAELALVMAERWAGASAQGTVLPQSWLFTTVFEDYRRDALKSSSWRILARLGHGAFTSVTGQVVQVILHIDANVEPEGASSYCEIDVSSCKGPAEKASALAAQPLAPVRQRPQLTNPSAMVMVGGASHSQHLSQFAEGRGGLSTGDDPSFVRFHWELRDLSDRWEFLQSSPDRGAKVSGCEKVILWEQERGRLARYAESVRGLNTRTQGWRSGKPLWGSRGVVIKRMGDLHIAPYFGEKFDRSCTVVCPKQTSDLGPLWRFASSGELERAVRSYHQRLSIEAGTILDAPVDFRHWRNLSAEGPGFPEPNSTDPTQWVFRGNPVESAQPLQVAVPRLLGYAWPAQGADALDELADSDGVVCLPAVGGEAPAHERLLQVLAKAYGPTWNPVVLDKLLTGAGAKPGADGLASWLRNGFFKEHCKLFTNRPFIWQIWDGTPDGFSALVNYHRLDRKLLERLTYDYLGNWWISRVKSDAANEVPSAETKLAAAEQLKAKLQLILEGETPYDIYIRWKTLADQPTGWNPDPDDGVRLNIRPFMTAGVLRAQPSINWNKDRGKNADGSERINDIHLTLAEKRAAQGNPQ
jgi:hypothetical protein